MAKWEERTEKKETNKSICISSSSFGATYLEGLKVEFELVAVYFSLSLANSLPLRRLYVCEVAVEIELYFWFLLRSNGGSGNGGGSQRAGRESAWESSSKNAIIISQVVTSNPIQCLPCMLPQPSSSSSLAIDWELGKKWIINIFLGF